MLYEVITESSGHGGAVGCGNHVFEADVHLGAPDIGGERLQTDRFGVDVRNRALTEGVRVPGGRLRSVGKPVALAMNLHPQAACDA